MSPIASANYNVTIASCGAGLSTGGAWSGAGTLASPLTWTPNASGSTVCNSDITGTGFATAAYVTVNTGSTGAEVGTITVAAPITWTQTGKTLTLVAGNDILVNADITVNAATGVLRFTPGAGRDYLLGAGVKINPAAGANNFVVGANSFMVITALGADGSITGTDLQGMAGVLNGKYALGADIDASTTTTWDSGQGFRPVGYDSVNPAATTFSGRLHGLGHSISGLTINRPALDYVGLIGYAFNAGEIRDLTLTGGSIAGRNALGAVAGYTSGALRNITSSANVTGSGTVGASIAGTGGVVGWADGSVIDSKSSGNVTTSADTVGGLVGYTRGSVVNSSASGNVSGANTVGGLVGFENGAGVSNSTASGNVSSTGNYVGGLIGFSRDAISASSATGNVSGASNIGGLIGAMQSGSVTTSHASGTVTAANASSGSLGGLIGSASSGTTITSSFATGNVTGSGANNYLGGFVGFADGNISSSYTTSNVSAVGASYVGGFVGYSRSNTISNAFALGNVAGSAYTGGFIGFHSDANVSDVYAAGNVTGTTPVGGVTAYQRLSSGTSTLNRAYASGTVTATGTKGGVVGTLASGSVTNGYWSAALSGLSAGVGSGVATGTTNLSAVQMKQQASFTGFDFTAGTGVWRIYNGNTFPLLRSFLAPLTITADNVSKPWDGIAVTSLTNVTYNPPSAVGSPHVLGIAPPYGAANTMNVGVYQPQVYSDQLGYNITLTGGQLTVTAPAFTLDVDGSAGASKFHAMTDGLLLLRHLLGLSGTALTQGATATSSPRNAAQISSYLLGVGAALDIDANGTYDAATDGLLVMRYLLGFRGAALIADAVGTCPPSTTCRTTATDIENYLATLTP